MTLVVVVDYGAGNTRSVRAALTRLGAQVELSSDPGDILAAPCVVLPGVGSARAAMDHLTTTGAANALRDRYAQGDALLGICLGMQLAMESSEEDGGVTTLGLLQGRVKRISSERIPRIGWATVEPWNETFFFAHSYACDSPCTTAFSEGVSAAVQEGSFTGVQFHPEKSGGAGSRWLASCLSLV